MEPNTHPTYHLPLIAHYVSNSFYNMGYSGSWESGTCRRDDAETVHLKAVSRVTAQLKIADQPQGH